MSSHRLIHPQWLCDSDQVPDRDSGISFRVDPEGRLDVLHRLQRRLLPDPHPSRLLSIFMVCSRGSGLPVSGSVLRSVHSSSFHQGLLPDIGVGASAGCASSSVSQQLVGCGRVIASSPSPSRSNAPVVPGPGHCDCERRIFIFVIVLSSFSLEAP